MSPETIEQELRPAVCQLRQTDRFKENYGHCISDDLSDDDNMARQYQQIYAQGNALLRKLFMCTESVKITLFQDIFLQVWTMVEL